MAEYSPESYTGDGTTDEFNISWSYLDETHVKVFVNEVEDTDFTWISSSRIKTSSVPAVDAAISITRNTPRDALTVLIPSSGTFRGQSINLQALQSLYVSEEASVTADEAKNQALANISDALQAVANAQAYAEDAEGSANSAASTATAIEAIYDSFDDRYLGLKSSDPSVDNDGEPLETGTLYFNTTAQQLRIYTGSEWLAAYIPSTNSVNSFNGRTGDVNPQAGDYATGDITGLQSALGGKSDVGHGHAIGDVTDLQGQLDAKASDASALKNNVEDQSIAGGAGIVSKYLGAVSSGTVTVDPRDRPHQHYSNQGAHTLSAPAENGSAAVLITNGASAGAITISGFDAVLGDDFDTTQGNMFRCLIERINGTTILEIAALQ